jgi:glycosyltransferase involved in cell wall biosynthesis
VLISLHRSEGFGLPIAEAMTLGVPALVTDWSGSTPNSPRVRWWRCRIASCR